MVGQTTHCDKSVDSIRSPLKQSLNSASKNDKSIHTLNVCGDDDSVKGEYEMARDKRVAEIQKMFRPVHEATRAL